METKTEVGKKLNEKHDVDMILNYRRLNSTKRFNNMIALTKESVAEHSYQTAIIAYTIASEYNDYASNFNYNLHPYDEKNLDTVNVFEVVMKALFHDVEETFTSDIPWNIKHSSLQLNSVLSSEIYKKLSSIYEGCSPVIQSHKAFKVSSKVNLSGKIVAIADYLEGSLYCAQELNSGNIYLYKLCQKYLIVLKNIDGFDEISKASPIVSSIMEYVYASLRRKSSVLDVTVLE